MAMPASFLDDTRLKILVNGDDDNKGAPMMYTMAYWSENYDECFNVFLEFGAVVELRNRYGSAISKIDNLSLFPLH